MADTEPSSIKKVLFILLALSVPLVILFMFVLRDLATRLIVLPILYILWVLDFLLASIPQVFFWFLMLFVVLRIAWRSLRRPSKTLHESQSLSSSAPPQGRVGLWRRRLDLASKGNYSQWGLARHAANLAANLLAYHEHISVREARARLKRGMIDAPPDIQAYFKAAMASRPPHTLRFFSRLLQRLGLREEEVVPSLNLDLERLVAFLEDQWEVVHDVEDY